MKDTLTIKNPTLNDLVVGVVKYYSGENIVKDFPRVLKQLIKEEYYILLKDYKTYDCIILLAERYKVTDRYIKNIIYY